MNEIIVDGTPRSANGSRPGIKEWQETVNAAARAAIDREDRFDFVDVSARILHFCFDGADAPDLDNIAKPILDAIAGIAFFNDNQVTELVLRRTDLQSHGITQVAGATPLLAERIERAFGAGDGLGFVYIAVDDAKVDHGRLP